MHLWVRKLELFQSDCNLSAPILSQLQLFQSCCTYFEPMWLELKQSDFSCFELTLIISIWLHHFYQESATFFVMLFPYFEQISQNNGPFRINFNSFQLAVCVCVFLRHLRVFQDDCTCSEPHTIISLQNCTSLNLTPVMRPYWVKYFWQVKIKLFSLCQLSCTGKKNKTNCITIN